MHPIPTDTCHCRTESGELILPLLVMVIFLLLLVIGYYVVAFFRHGVAYHPFYMDEQYLSVNVGDPKQIRHTFVTGRNGNYMVEMCTTDDGTFMALQILQFQQLRYEPVTSVLMFEGEQAQIVKQIF